MKSTTIWDVIRKALCGSLVALYATGAWAEPEASEDSTLPSDLREVSLERLLNFDLVVTSPGRKEQKVSNVGSAVFVLTRDDIARSGATHVADLLRLVPGVDVAQIASNKWAVSVRGFNQVFADKLLVLVDGVSIFAPTTNGVYWEANEIPPSQIERIEVVRGPGGALWGANAVNGVINIVTKHAKDSQGTVVTSGGGSHERAFSEVTHGGEFGESSQYRLFATARRRDQFKLVEGGGAQDDWTSYAGGMRVDSQLSDTDTLLTTLNLQAQDDALFSSSPILEPPYFDTMKFNRGNTNWRGLSALTRWNRKASASEETSIGLSYTRREREAELVSFNYDQAILDGQHRFNLFDGHDFMIGGSYAYFYNSTDDSPGHEVNPNKRHTENFEGFLQDEIRLWPDTATLTVGSRFEVTDPTGLEVMPNLKLVVLPAERVAVWGSIARAISAPGIFLEDARIPFSAFPVEGTPLTALTVVQGNRSVDAEELMAYETGLRLALSSEFSVDIAAFYNDYDNLFSVEAGEPQVGQTAEGQTALIIPLEFENRATAESWGGEISFEWNPDEVWKLAGSYSYQQIEVTLGSSGDTTLKELFEGGTPRHKSVFRVERWLSEDLYVAPVLRYVSGLDFGNVDRYIELDLKMGWKIAENVEFALVGQNLLHDEHQEFEGNLLGPRPTEIERGVYGSVTVSF